MRSGRAVQEHSISTRDWHVERADICLAVLERDVAAVHTGIHGCACCVSSGLGYGVVAVAELELHDVADGGDDGVGDEGVLWTSDYYGDDLAGAAVGFDWGYGKKQLYDEEQ